MNYVLIWNNEKIDWFDSLEEAKKMKLEYQLACCGSVRIKEVVQMNNTLLDYKMNLKDCLVGGFLAFCYILAVFGPLMFSKQLSRESVRKNIQKANTAGNHRKNK